MRKFKTGSIRDTNKGKISYYGFRHPLVEHSFGKYMLKHQKQADGQLRSPNNWWGGWSEDISIDSLIRHAEDLQAIHAGLYVYKVRDNGEETVVLPYPYKEIFKKEPGRCKIIDSSGTVEETNEQIVEAMEKFYKDYLKKFPEKRQRKLF